MGAVIQKIIHKVQSGFLKGPCIQDNLRLIQDVVDYAYIDKVPGAICALDFRAAFNSLEHSFIVFALRKFGFGESFIRWVKLLYNGTELAIINNGFTSEWFKPKRGIMQGCPLSGMLFVVAVELLAIKIRQNAEIKGICLSNQEFKISQYADDTTVFVRDQESVKALMSVLKEFAKLSGLELNVNKSKLMWVGTSCDLRDSVCGMPVVSRVKILGVWFSATENCQQANIQPVVDNISLLMRVWQQRALSVKGRVTVAKSLLISKFIYVMPCVKIEIAQLRTIQSHIMKFLWRGRPPKVSAKVLRQEVADGGLGAPDVECMYASLKLGWMRKLFKDLPWSQLFRTRCYPLCINDLLNARYEKKDLERFRLSAFYADLLATFRNVCVLNDPDSPTEIKRELIWLNKFIHCGNKSLFEENLYTGGLRYVGDITSNTGALMNFTDVKRKFPGVKINFLRYFGIVSAMPAVWKAKLRETSTLADNDDMEDRLPAVEIKK